MTLEDFSTGFDTLLNSFATVANFGKTDSPISIELDEFEKSIFLTEAQEELVLSLYSGRNSSGNGFEETEELRRNLSNLIFDVELSPITNTGKHPIGGDSNSYYFTLPDGTIATQPSIWFITYESVTISSDDTCKNGTTMEVVPAKQDEYHRLKKNPFRGANSRRALRFDLSEDNIEIVCKYTVTKYYVRYLKKLKPIILVNLADGNTIQGEVTAMNSELDSSLHRAILERAVEKAIQSRGYTKNIENK